jgi:hypothetical protein
MEGQEEKGSGCFFLLAGGRGGGRGYERGEGAPYRGIPFNADVRYTLFQKSIQPSKRSFHLEVQSIRSEPRGVE